MYNKYNPIYEKPDKIKESFYEYKGYIIRLRFSVMGRNGSTILRKTEENKWFNLREYRFNFIKPNDAIQKAKDYIDEFGDKLEEKFNKQYNEWIAHTKK